MPRRPSRPTSTRTHRNMPWPSPPRRHRPRRGLDYRRRPRFTPCSPKRVTTKNRCRPPSPRPSGTRRGGTMRTGDCLVRRRVDPPLSSPNRRGGRAPGRRPPRIRRNRLGPESRRSRPGTDCSRVPSLAGARTRPCRGRAGLP